MGAWPAEFVDGKRKSSNGKCLEELFPRPANGSAPNDDDKVPDEHSGLLEEMILQESSSRGCPKALFYKDILRIIVHHLETGKDGLAMSIKLAHHIGVDNKPKP
jgi:hypothetical protein